VNKTVYVIIEMLVISVIPSIVFSQTYLVGVRFYIYGTVECGYCRFVKQLFTIVYGPSHVVFRDIHEGRYYEIFSKVFSLLNLGEEATPLIIIYSDDILEAVVVGAIPAFKNNVAITSIEDIITIWQDFLNSTYRERDVMVSVGSELRKVSYDKVAEVMYKMVLQEEDRIAVALYMAHIFSLFNDEPSFSKEYYSFDAVFNYSGVSYALQDIPEVVADLREMWGGSYIKPVSVNVSRSGGIIWVKGMFKLLKGNSTAEASLILGFTRVDGGLKIAKEKLEIS